MNWPFIVETGPPGEVTILLKNYLQGHPKMKNLESCLGSFQNSPSVRSPNITARDRTDGLARLLAGSAASLTGHSGVQWSSKSSSPSRLKTENTAERGVILTSYTASFRYLVRLKNAAFCGLIKYSNFQKYWIRSILDFFSDSRGISGSFRALESS